MRYLAALIKSVIASLFLGVFNTLIIVGLPLLAAILIDGPTEGKIFINVISSMVGPFFIACWVVGLLVVFTLLNVANFIFKSRLRFEGYFGIGLIYGPYIYSTFPNTLSWGFAFYFLFQTSIIGHVFNAIYIKFIKMNFESSTFTK